MGAGSSSHEESAFLNSYDYTSQQGEKTTLNSVVTPNVRTRWGQAAQNLSFAQDIIIMNGPFYFVRRCLDSSMVKTEERFQKYLFAFVFIVVFPFVMPVAFFRMFMQHSWGWEKVGEQRIQWSREHNFFKIFQDNDDFITTNARIDIAKLRLALINTTQESVGNVLYLSDQDFQSQLSNHTLQRIIGGVTVLVALILICVRHSQQNRRWLKWFTFHILHFQWYSESYDKLKYTSATLFNGKLKLYKAVPCVWLAILTSFTGVIPISVFAFDQQYSYNGSGFLDWNRWYLLLKSMPYSLLAGYVVGNLYLELANATFTLWLSSPLEYAVAERQFITEMGGLFKKLTTHLHYFSVSSEEIETLANLRSVELWLNFYTIKALRLPRDINNSEDMKVCWQYMEAGDWENANQHLTQIMRRIKDTKKNGRHEISLDDARRKRMKNHLTTNIYIADKRSDIAFWVDIKKGTCKRVTGEVWKLVLAEEEDEDEA